MPNFFPPKYEERFFHFSESRRYYYKRIVKDGVSPFCQPPLYYGVLNNHPVEDEVIDLLWL